MTSSVVFEPVLSAKQAAELLGIHPKTIMRKAREGDIPGHFKLDKWFFRASELNEWLTKEN